MASILYLFGRNPRGLYCLDLVSLTDAVEREYPLGWSSARLQGSCRRVLCISQRLEFDFAIWNPSTGICRLLPRSNSPLHHRLFSRPIPRSIDSVCVHGFGYDDRNREYVLLRLNQTLERPLISEVSIYRSRANAWTRRQWMPYYLSWPPAMGVFLHCRLYWIMTRKWLERSAKMLVAFDIRTENFEDVGLPHLIDTRLHMDLTVLGEHLCLIVYSRSRQGRRRGVNVWIVDGLNGPWERLFSIGELPRGWETVRPLAYSQNDRRVLVEVSDDTFIWYDLHTSDVEPFHINGMPNFYAATCL